MSAHHCGFSLSTLLGFAAGAPPPPRAGPAHLSASVYLPAADSVRTCKRSTSGTAAAVAQDAVVHSRPSALLPGAWLWVSSRPTCIVVPGASKHLAYLKEVGGQPGCTAAPPLHGGVPGPCSGPDAWIPRVLYPRHDSGAQSWLWACNEWAQGTPSRDMGLSSLNQKAPRTWVWISVSLSEHDR